MKMVSRVVLAAASGSLFGLLGACAKSDNKARDTVATSAPSPAPATPSAGQAVWQNATKYQRKDSAGNIIFVEVKDGQDLFVVDRMHHPVKEMVVGQFRNTGDANGRKLGKESVYGFETSDKVSYELVILPKGDPHHNNKTVWEMREIPNDGSVSSNAPRTGYLDLCEPVHAPHEPAVGFKSCVKDAATKAAVKHSSLLGMGLFTTAFRKVMALIQENDSTKINRDQDPAWISCTDGCCTLRESAE